MILHKALHYRNLFSISQKFRKSPVLYVGNRNSEEVLEKG